MTCANGREEHTEEACGREGAGEIEVYPAALHGWCPGCRSKTQADLQQARCRARLGQLVALASGARLAPIRGRRTCNACRRSCRAARLSNHCLTPLHPPVSCVGSTATNAD
jgi:hypothetical protein